jgi:hypothetical protein
MECNQVAWFLVNDQSDAQFFTTYLFLFLTLYVSRAGRNRPAHDTATDTEWQSPEVVLTQFLSLDDEHDVLETCRELKAKIKINT